MKLIIIILSFFIAIGIVASASAWLTRDLDCEDFGSQEAAQKKFLQSTRDVHGLDGDNDGNACENK